MRHLDFLRSMYATHVPYWLTAIAIALTVRRARRLLDSIALALRTQQPPET